MKTVLVLFTLAVVGILAEDVCVEYSINTCPNAVKKTFCSKDASGNIFEQPPCDATDANVEHPVASINSATVMRNGLPYSPCTYGQQCWGFQQYQPEACGCNQCPCQQYDVSYIPIRIPIPVPRPPPPPPQPQQPIFYRPPARQPNVRVKMNNALEVNIENSCNSTDCDHMHFTPPPNTPPPPPPDCGCNTCPCVPAPPPSCGCDTCPCVPAPPPSCGCDTCPCNQVSVPSCGCKTCPCPITDCGCHTCPCQGRMSPLAKMVMKSNAEREEEKEEVKTEKVEDAN